MQRQERPDSGENAEYLHKIKRLLEAEIDPEILDAGSSLCLRGDQGCTLVVLVAGKLRFRYSDDEQNSGGQHGVLKASGPVAIYTCLPTTEIVAETCAELFLIPFDLDTMRSDKGRAITFQLCSYQMTALVDALADYAILQKLDAPVGSLFDAGDKWH